MKFAKFLTFLGIFSLVAGCGEQKKTNKQAEGGSDIIKVVTSADFPPLSYKDSGELKGYEIDLINEVGKRLGKRVQIEDLDLNDLFKAVESGEAHLGIAGLSKTPERMEKFDFSNAYYQSPSVMMLSVDNTSTSLDDFNNKVILIQEDSSQDFLVGKLVEKFKAANIVKMKNINDLVRQFEQNFDDTTVLFLDQVVAENLLANNPHLKIKLITVESSDYDYGMIFQKGNHDFVADINKVLKTMESDGTVEKLKKKNGIF